MRCKNCGTENDDNRYICENCGSPLYDEEDFNDAASDTTPLPVDDPPAAANGTVDGGAPQPPHGNGDGKQNDKKNIIVIAILAVVLVAIIASVIVIASAKSKNGDETSSASTTTTTPQSQSQSYTQRTTTERSTTTETTTERTTASTTTAARSWSVRAISSGGGTVSGSGTYRDGENVTITAIADQGYEFEGWYSGGQKISSAASYSFSAVENISISAQFTPITTEDTENMDGDLTDDEGRIG